MTQHADRGLLPLVSVRPGWAGFATVAAVAVVGAQIAYPLLSGTALTGVTVLTVALFVTAVVAQAAASWGPGPALRLLLTVAGLSLATEAVALRTGVPFGSYRYATSLGPAVLGVPLVVLGAWTMMAGPALLAARRLAAAVAGSGPDAGARRVRRLLVPAAGGVTLAAWDLFLDPQMVGAGFWTWDHPDPGLPGVPGVPLTNLAGWLLTGTVLCAVLDAALPPTSGQPQLVVAALLAWTWGGSTLANLAFFDRPALAGYGAVALGLTVAPYLLLTRRDAAGRGPRSTR